MAEAAEAAEVGAERLVPATSYSTLHAVANIPLPAASDDDISEPPHAPFVASDAVDSDSPRETSVLNPALNGSGRLLNVPATSDDTLYAVTDVPLPAASDDDIREPPHNPFVASDAVPLDSDSPRETSVLNPTSGRLLNVPATSRDTFYTVTDVPLPAASDNDIPEPPYAPFVASNAVPLYSDSPRDTSLLNPTLNGSGRLHNVPATSYDTLYAVANVPLPAASDDDIREPPRAPFLAPSAVPLDSDSPRESSYLTPTLNGSGALLNATKLETYAEDAITPASSKSKRRSVILVVFLVALVLILIAVVVPVYFTVIKPKKNVANSNSPGVEPGPNSGGGSGGGSTPSPGSPTAITGGDGSTIHAADGSTFTYKNSFGGFCKSFTIFFFCPTRNC
jgi:hypothetical protein